ncbi:hypothetical protein DFH06DRAFT_1269536 [Mycena polygramma]|nr:hypothetical protein DFH06DRAFT_1269536 [Mycena polygramma]
MPPIVIIGAGIGGVSLAIALKRQLGFDDFIIYEKGSDIGGTWRGASSDVSIHFYSLSTDLNPDWPSTHGSQPDIQDYWRKLTAKYDLYRRIVFNRLVVSAEWNSKEQSYRIITVDVGSGERFSTSATILISAIGLVEVPQVPSIAGLSSFKGEMFHPARWDMGADLRGKRVAVVGNGASATQFVPIISQDPSVQVTEFCRTPNWFLPPIRADYSPLWKWTFRNIPLAMRIYRLFLYLRMTNLQGRKNYIKRTAPKGELEHLIPKYNTYPQPPIQLHPAEFWVGIGCKRITFDTNFLEALHRPNMKLNWDGIQSISEDGIITKKGQKLSFDVIIFGTGFIADRYPLTVVGNTGKTVQEYYDSQGGPKAYLGTTIPGFPNLLVIGGPNTASGYTSVILTEEMQINYILQVVKPILDGSVSSVDVTTRETNTYNELIHARLARSVFVHCVSWYRSGGKGKVSSIFPGPMFLYGWLCSRSGPELPLNPPRALSTPQSDAAHPAKRVN